MALLKGFSYFLLPLPLLLISPTPASTSTPAPPLAPPPAPQPVETQWSRRLPTDLLVPADPGPGHEGRAGQDTRRQVTPTNMRSFGVIIKNYLHLKQDK